MQFKPLTIKPLALKQQLLWAIYSAKMKSFIVGDEQSAVAISPREPGNATPLVADVRPHAGGRHPCNLPIPAALYAEFASRDWHGFRLLEAAAYDHAFDKKGAPAGDLLRMIVFGPDQGHFVLHPPTGLVVSLRASSMELLRRNDAGFELLDQTRTKGKASLAFAGHPTEPLIVYGDNYGVFHAHPIEGTKFAKATKIADRERNASRADFIRGGAVLLIAGMGYLASYSYAGGRFAPLHETSMAVRDFIAINDGSLILVNNGLHGISAWRYDDGGFAKLATVPIAGGVGQIAVSDDGRFVAATAQQSPTLHIVELQD